jgi:hypothetical protein
LCWLRPPPPPPPPPPYRCKHWLAIQISKCLCRCACRTLWHVRSHAQPCKMLLVMLHYQGAAQLDIPNAITGHAAALTLLLHTCRGAPAHTTSTGALPPPPAAPCSSAAQRLPWALMRLQPDAALRLGCALQPAAREAQLSPRAAAHAAELRRAQPLLQPAAVARPMPACAGS